MKRAVVTGVTGQDGSYLAEFLVHLGYKVYGLARRSSVSYGLNFRLDRLMSYEGENFKLVIAEPTDMGPLSRIISEEKIDEFYNLSAQSDVKVSFSSPVFTAESTGVSALRYLEVFRAFSPATKIYQASSSEMFGSTPPPQNSSSRFEPQSPYGIAKLFAYHSTKNYRDSYGMFTANGILFNHESPRRGRDFVTKKIVTSLVAITNNSADSLTLGNLNARRDWGYAPEYVVAMWKLLQLDEPEDVSIGTGKSYSVEDFLMTCSKLLGIEAKDYVSIDSGLERPSEVASLRCDPVEAENLLGWRSRVDLDSLASKMVDHEREHQSGEGPACDKVNWTETASNCLD